MAFSPLAIDKQTVKELKIDTTMDVSPIRKLAFLQAQLEEMESVAWRERVNIVHAARLQQSDIEAIRLKGNNNMVEHKNTAKQFAEGIAMIKQFIRELRETYPELQVEE